VDAVAEHVLVLHALAGALGRVRAAEAEDGRALGHTQHLAAAVVGQPAEPELDGVAEALVTDDGEVVHIEEVETGLKGGRKTASRTGFGGISFFFVEQTIINMPFPRNIWAGQL